MKKILCVKILFLFMGFSFLYGQAYRLKPDFPGNAILLELPNNKSTGSGVVVQVDSLFLLVTAKHVLIKEIYDTLTKITTRALLDKTCMVSFYSKDSYSSKKYSYEVNLDEVVQAKGFGFSKTKDMAIIVIGKLINDGGKSLLRSTYGVRGINTSVESILNITNENNFASFEKLQAGDEAFIIGYPTSLNQLKSDQYNFQRPLLSKGIVAGKDHIRETFVSDCPAFHGNSGGPIFVIMDKRAKLAGIVVEYIPYVIPLPLKSSGKTLGGVVNSGYSVVIPIEHLFDFLER